MKKENSRKNTNDLHTQLGALRISKNLSQKELSKILGYNVNMFESGERRPNIDKLIEIADFFNVTTDYLLGISDIQNYDDLTSRIVSPEEKHMIQAFNQSPENIKRGILALLNIDEETSEPITNKERKRGKSAKKTSLPEQKASGE